MAIHQKWKPSLSLFRYFVIICYLLFHNRQLTKPIQQQRHMVLLIVLMRLVQRFRDFGYWSMERVHASGCIDRVIGMDQIKHVCTTEQKTLSAVRYVSIAGMRVLPRQSGQHRDTRYMQCSPHMIFSRIVHVQRQQNGRKRNSMYDSYMSPVLYYYIINNSLRTRDDCTMILTVYLCTVLTGIIRG